MLTLVNSTRDTLPPGLADHLPHVIRAEVPARAKMADMTVEEYVRYATDCLEGQRFPEVGDKWLWDYCRTHYTLREVVELYRIFHLATLKDPASTLCKVYKYLKPLFPVKLGEITRQGVTQWYFENAKTSRVQATGALKALRAIYNKATLWEIYEGNNPASGVKKFRQDARTRFIQPGEEMQRCLDSLLMETDQIQAFFLLCLLCACRGGEARAMKWADLDFTKNLWHKPMTKTGTPHTVPLPDEIAGRLKALPRLGPYVFGTLRGNTYWPATTAFLYWKRIRSRAGLHDVTIHDLRRTWASWAAMDGENLAVIAKVLNHSNIQQTQIYARLNAAPVYRAMAKQAAAMMTPKGSAEEAKAREAQPLENPFAVESVKGRPIPSPAPAPMPLRIATPTPLAPLGYHEAARESQVAEWGMEWPG